MSLAPKKSTPNFRILQASFEQQQPDPNTRNLQAIYPAHRSKAGDLAPSANVSRNAARIPSLTKSIDSVLDTPAAANRPTSHPNRPLAKFRPSWIGPQPSKRTNAEIVGRLEPVMKQRVHIDFASPGLQPPVYIFTSLSHPQWEATEMFPVKQVSGEFTFVRSFEVEEGEYQYKFRLGPGDWWVCDEAREIVDDGAGNRNNRVLVAKPGKKAVDSGHTTPETELVVPKSAGLMPTPVKHMEPVVTRSVESSPHTELNKAHETFSSPQQGSSGQQTPERELANPMSSAEHAPIPHTHSESKDERDDEAESYNTPLLRHESLSPNSHGETHSPLFRHESINLGHHNLGDTQPLPEANRSNPKPAFRTAIAARLAPQEADPNDPSLHRFSTQQDGIVEHIQNMRARLPEDETGHDVNNPSSPSSAALSETSSISAVPALASVNEENDEQLDKIREAGSQGVEAEQESGEELDPLKEGQAAEAEDADFEPKISELKVIVVPKVEKTIEEIVLFDRRQSLTDLKEKAGTRNLMAIAVGLLAVVAAVTIVKLFK